MRCYHSASEVLQRGTHDSLQHEVVVSYGHDDNVTANIAVQALSNRGRMMLRPVVHSTTTARTESYHRRRAELQHGARTPHPATISVTFCYNAQTGIKFFAATGGTPATTGVMFCYNQHRLFVIIGITSCYNQQRVLLRLASHQPPWGCCDPCTTTPRRPPEMLRRALQDAGISH